LAAIPQEYVFFVDDNILGYGKSAEQRAFELFRGMIGRKLRTKCLETAFWAYRSNLNFRSVARSIVRTD
jgi:hypothetical protein